MCESSNDATNTSSTRTVTVEIEEDLMVRAEACYPASPNNTELVRRVFERGLNSRERELAEGDGEGWSVE